MIYEDKPVVLVKQDYVSPADTMIMGGTYVRLLAARADGDEEVALIEFTIVDLTRCIQIPRKLLDEEHAKNVLERLDQSAASGCWGDTPELCAEGAAILETGRKWDAAAKMWGRALNASVGHNRRARYYAAQVRCATRAINAMSEGIHDTPGGTVFEGRDAVRVYQAKVVASGLRLYARTRIRPGRAWTPRKMMGLASAITQRRFGSRDYLGAAEALDEWISLMRSALPSK